MPELPEVEVARRNLARWSARRELRDVVAADASAVRGRTSTRPSAASPAALRRLKALVGRKAGALERHGKRLAWRFGDDALVLHLGMTGRWSRRNGDEPPRFGRVGLVFGDDTLWFVDPRRFGSIVPLPAGDAERALHEGLGPDALLDPLDGPRLAAALAGRRPVKVALLDQARIAGLGNMQAVEALFRAGIDPRARVADLDGDAWDRLAAAIPVQLEHALALTASDEVAYLSDGGDVENPFEVYGRGGEPCHRCGTPIASTTLGGRSTSWCPTCQPGAVRA